LAAAEPAFRPGVDRPLFDDCGCRVAGLAGRRLRERPLPLEVYALQLILNAAWTPLFFGLHRPDLGFVDIVLVWLSIVVTIVLFYPINAGAALLLVPYLAWVTFATALNFAVWRLNSAASSEA
jgi:tryptophan-rich sensory protein